MINLRCLFRAGRRFVLVGAALLLAGCASSRPVRAMGTAATQSRALPTFRFPYTPSATAQATRQIASPTSKPQVQLSPQPVARGPQTYSPGINPLTGLAVADAGSLDVVPLLVSVTNFPPSSRPQAGLSLAAHVWETSIGQGMTRFLAVYYGDTIRSFSDLAGSYALDNPYDFVIGPVRSGRIGFEEIKLMYPSARLLIRYASAEVIGRLSNWELVTASNFEDINSAGLSLDELLALPLPHIEPGLEGGLAFDVAPPDEGTPAARVDLFYNIYNRVAWEYDPQRGQFLRWQDASNGSQELHPALDRLTGEQLGFENVVVLWSYHRYENIQGTILELGLSYMPDGFGLLYRDGVVQQVRWSTLKGRLSIHDELGRVVDLKPGRTFFEVVSQLSTWDEQASYIRFYSPSIPTATPTTTATPTATPSLEPAAASVPPESP